MSVPTIAVRNLGKQYRVGARERYHALRDTLTEWVRLPLQLLSGRRAPSTPGEDFIWALKDFSLDVNAGEVLGIIGRNGAGKSTLLKLLSRVTEPTEGEGEICGRAGTLLEVGTGFHPELTGRENIFLNGAILGMRRGEIRRKFDEIVAFAGVERFLDTPVKHFSSGMYVRLAFAVAAHLECEILFVDEVLAVGDSSFQKKCLEKMSGIAQEGRTVLVVSHNMAAIRQMCSRAVLIDGGRLVADGPALEVVQQYANGLQQVAFDPSVGLADRLNRSAGSARIVGVRVVDSTGQHRWGFQSGETFRIELDWRTFEPVNGLNLYVALHSGPGSEVVTTVKTPVFKGERPADRSGRVTVEFSDAPLRPGEYYLYLWLGDELGDSVDVVEFRNASLPPISIGSDEKDMQLTAGYFSIPTRVSVEER